MKSRLTNELKKINTSLRKAFGRSDIRRWRKPGELSPDWDSRTEIMAKYIPENASIIEFGAGRLVLKSFLPKGCTYTPSDIVDRGEGTKVIDLNRHPLPEIDNYDYAVFSGVLEYINNVPLIISHFSKYINAFIISYAIADNHPSDRGIHGWGNNYKEVEIISLFTVQNYELINKDTWGKQAIFVFKKTIL